ncbi:SRPBCC family protein [Agromyces arachidis]|uniref:SRPBCC family protein n=1 Tax=Agromyces arachidis TaxID=766966 RepID=UPI0040560918
MAGGARIGTTLAVAAGAVAAIAAVRRVSLRWGATDDERTRPLPGDGFLPRADLQATRAIRIEAPRADVWPWIAQIGQGRGGFYTYDRLENLVGCDIRSADVLLPEARIRGVGETVRLHPQVALDVVAFAEDDHLVLRGGVGPDGRTEGAPYDFTWAFVLVDAPGDATRLVVRERYGYLEPWAAALVEPVQLVSFFMSERMLRGIRDRAEGVAAR